MAGRRYIELVRRVDSEDDPADGYASSYALSCEDIDLGEPLDLEPPTRGPRRRRWARSATREGGDSHPDTTFNPGGSMTITATHPGTGPGAARDIPHESIALVPRPERSGRRGRPLSAISYAVLSTLDQHQAQAVPVALNGRTRASVGSMFRQMLNRRMIKASVHTTQQDEHTLLVWLTPGEGKRRKRKEAKKEE